MNFQVRRGEILGVGGLVGAQRTELLEAIYGIRSSIDGKIIKDGNNIKVNNPKDAIKNGIALLTEDRRATGIFGVLSVRDNTSVASLNNYVGKGGLLDQKKLDILDNRNSKSNDGLSKLNKEIAEIKTEIKSGNLTTHQQTRKKVKLKNC